MSYGVGRRHSSDPLLLWLWHRLAAVALIGPLAWEPPYAACVALKRQKKNCMDYLYTTLCDIIYITCRLLEGVKIQYKTDMSWFLRVVITKLGDISETSSI